MTASVPMFSATDTQVVKRASGDHHPIRETIGPVPENVFNNAIDFHAR